MKNDGRQIDMNGQAHCQPFCSDMPDSSPANGEFASADPVAHAQPSLLLKDVMRAHITHVLVLRNWVIEGPHGACAALGMKPSTLRYRMQILGIRKPAA